MPEDGIIFRAEIRRTEAGLEYSQQADQALLNEAAVSLGSLIDELRTFCDKTLFSAQKSRNIRNGR